MIEKVDRLVRKDIICQEGFVSFLLSQMSRELVDRVVEKIINDGDVICTYKGVEALEYPNTEQVEMRSGIDIRPLVRCKDCKYNDQGFCEEVLEGKSMPGDWFCAGGEKRGDVTQ